MRSGDLVYRNASWRALAMVVAVLAAITGYVAIPKGETTDPVLVVVPGLVTLFFLVLLLLRIAVCLRPENWLLRIAPDGLYLKFRSHMNRRLPTDTPTVLFLENAEVQGVCIRRENRYLPGRYGGTSHDRFSYVDLLVDFAGGRADAESLAAALHRERRLPGLRHPDFPVRLVPPMEKGDPALVRLVWDQIRPHEGAAVDALERRFARLPDVQCETPRWAALDNAGKEAFIAALWEMGHVEDAEQLVRLHHQVGRRGVDAYFRKHFGDS